MHKLTPPLLLEFEALQQAFVHTEMIPHTYAKENDYVHGRPLEPPLQSKAERDWQGLHIVSIASGVRLFLPGNGPSVMKVYTGLPTASTAEAF